MNPTAILHLMKGRMEELRGLLHHEVDPGELRYPLELWLRFYHRSPLPLIGHNSFELAASGLVFNANSAITSLVAYGSALPLAREITHERRAFYSFLMVRSSTAAQVGFRAIYIDDLDGYRIIDVTNDAGRLAFLEYELSGLQARADTDRLLR